MCISYVGSVLYYRTVLNPHFTVAGTAGVSHILDTITLHNQAAFTPYIETVQK